MAKPRDIRPGQESDRLALAPLVGYRLPPNRSVEDVLEDYAELLRSEGIDPTWHGFKQAGQT
jgi:hypothetical protein